MGNFILALILALWPSYWPSPYGFGSILIFIIYNCFIISPIIDLKQPLPHLPTHKKSIKVINDMLITAWKRKMTVLPTIHLPNPNTLSRSAHEFSSLTCATFTGCCCAEIGRGPHGGHGGTSGKARRSRRELGNLDPAPQPDDEFRSIEVCLNKDITENRLD